jgi:pyruvate/2-oxoglutarate dehydrogenase complex dihydrolipoamide acyltransferase (E2) component
MTTPLSTSEPNRLSEELGENSSSLERALLRAGSSYASSPQTRVRVLAGLGLAAGSTALFTGSAAAASAAASSAAKLTWTKLLLGVSLVGATAVPVSYYALQSAAPAATPAPQRAAVSAPAVAEPAPAPAVAATPAAALLIEELGALDHARLALVNGEGRRTLEELDAYDRRFPSGRLQIEAEVLRIDALAKLGRKEAARQRAEAFLRRHPNSVLATRVRAHVAD